MNLLLHTQQMPTLNKYYHTNLSISGHYLLNEVSLSNEQKREKNRTSLCTLFRRASSISFLPHKEYATKANKYFEHTYSFVAHFNGFSFAQNWYYNLLQTIFFFISYSTQQSINNRKFAAHSINGWKWFGTRSFLKWTLKFCKNFSEKIVRQFHLFCLMTEVKTI